MGPKTQKAARAPGYHLGSASPRVRALVLYTLYPDGTLEWAGDWMMARASPKGGVAVGTSGSPSVTAPGATPSSPKQLFCRAVVFTPHSSPILAFLSFWLQGALCLSVCLYVCVYLGKRAICKSPTEVSYYDHISKDEWERKKGI